MNKDLTEKQQAIFDFIKEAISGNGIPPTVREIGDRFGITVKGAYDHLKAIEKKGFLRCLQNKSRAIEILRDKDERGDGTIQIPLIGQIAAGVPLLADENIDEYLPFPASSFSGGTFFALKVKGDSMIEEGILDGDIAVIRQQPDANNGEIVAALLEDGATLKILSKSKKSIELLPANSSYSPIIAQNVSILGILKGIFRKYV